MNDYQFQENELEHGSRLGNFNHVRHLRRAILERLTGERHPGTPEYMRHQCVEELMQEAGVALSGSTLVPKNPPQLVQAKMQAMHQLGLMVQEYIPGRAHMQSKTTTRVAAGLPPSVCPYPYFVLPDGRVDIDHFKRTLIRNGFDALNAARPMERLQSISTSTAFPQRRRRSGARNQFAHSCRTRSMPGTSSRSARRTGRRIRAVRSICIARTSKSRWLAWTNGNVVIL